LTEKQAEKLKVKPRTQISGYLEKCCLLVSANNSYQRTEEDLFALTGIRITHSTQQRLVHRQEFQAWEAPQSVDTLCIDGGKARIRTPLGEQSAWKDYKAVSLSEQGVGAYFQKNQQLVNWVNSQPLASTVSCLGDGHDGIWNLFGQIGVPQQRQEILDWFHLIENLHKVGGSLNRLSQVRTLLWQGKVDEAIQAFSDCSLEAATNFVAYLTKHRHRIPNYQYLQMEGVTIGSGSVESLVKQVGRRVKISGAQWDSKNVDQVLKQRCAYLNGQFSMVPIPQTAD
jgi:hypothetical protein